MTLRASTRLPGPRSPSASSMPLPRSGTVPISPSANCGDRNWGRVNPFFTYPAEIRIVIYITTPIGSPEQCHKESWQVPERRCDSEVVLPGTAQHRQDMYHADPRQKGGNEPVYDAIRGLDAGTVTENSFTQNFTASATASHRYITTIILSTPIHVDPFSLGRNEF